MLQEGEQTVSHLAVTFFSLLPCELTGASILMAFNA